MKPIFERELFQRARVLDAATCEEIDATVHALRAHWIARDAAAMYTLGAALYLDAPTPETAARFGLSDLAPDRYARHMASTAPLLRVHFSPLYAALTAALESLLGCEVRFAANRALPGFHIFGAAAIYASSTAHVPHFDRQYECIDWPNAAEIDFSRTISVTLPIRLPTSGGGLRVWNLSLDEVQTVPKHEARRRAAAAESRVHRYAAGELICHPGQLLHQIQPWAAVPGDERVTLQAHGLFYDGAWQLYW